MSAYLKQRFAAIPNNVWFVLLTLACLMPFLDKAFHIDDTLFLRAAQQIQNHPADFYGFSMNWFGTTQPMIENFDNPPLACYYIALVAAAFGWSETVLHLSFLLPAAMVILGILSLAKYHCSRPAVAAIIALTMPVFIISSTTLMCDVLMLAFWIWTIVFFERGLQCGGIRFFFLSGFLGGMAVLTKFSGIALIPLLAVYGLHRTRRHGWWLVALFVPLLLAGACEWITYSLYGKGLFLTAAGVSSKSKGHGGSFLERCIVGISFVGGCFLPLLLFIPYLWSAKRIITGLCLLLPCLLVFPRLGKYSLLWNVDGTPDWLLFVQSVLFLIGGVHVLLLAASDVWSHRSPSSLLLLLWTFGIFTFAAGLNWSINGRSILPMLPAVAILIVRRLDRQFACATVQRRWWPLWPVLPGIAISLGLARADVDLAKTGRLAAAELFARYRTTENKLWFEGHWGFQYYMEQRGAKALERDFALPKKGDIVVVPSEAVNTFDLSTDLVRLLDTLEYRPNTFCSTMSLSAGAGFYAATAGPFPFSLGRIDPERFYIFQVVETMEAARKASGGMSRTGAVAQQFELERRALECEAAIRHNPNHENAHLQLARFLAARSKFQEAGNQFSEVLRINPQNGEAHFEFATLLVQLKKRDDAVSHYRAAVQLMPDNIRASEALSKFLAANKDLPGSASEKTNFLK
jgi:4-amino-4-deoxy-L-arabinose transferase-like glycosyltransferase/tetratricopeptide (TPR) repeat protein